MSQRDRAFYWQFVCLDGQSGCQHREIPAARAYFNAQFRDRESSDAAIARQLYATWQAEPLSPAPTPAELCLRCYISNYIEQTCWQLAERFGKARGFGLSELRPLVLMDVSLAESLRPLLEGNGEARYRPLAADILRTYEPERGSLSAWTQRLVRQQRDFTEFLRDRGVYLISDWALLNDTQPHRLGRLLPLSERELERYAVLLSSYHAIYRRDRLARGTSSRCLPPSTEQLQRIARRVQQAGLDWNPAVVFNELRALAELLRYHRLQRRAQSPLAESLDDPNLHATAIASRREGEEMQREFLHRYQQILHHCLEAALERALRECCQRRPERAPQFLEALDRFYARGETMTEIAAKIGMKAQYQVSRLLQLKQLREMTSRYALELLAEQVTELARTYADPERLHDLYATVQAAIASELTEVMQEAASEAEAKQRQVPARSLFARSLCASLERLRRSQAFEQTTA